MSGHSRPHPVRIVSAKPAFEVALAAEQEDRFSRWVGVADMTPWQRSVARLALLLNTTGRGLIDYGAAQHFANELMDRAGAARPGPEVVAREADHPSEFSEGQWWLVELDAMAAAGTPDQKRAVAVVRHLLRSAHQHCLSR